MPDFHAGPVLVSLMVAFSEESLSEESQYPCNLGRNAGTDCTIRERTAAQIRSGDAVAG